MNITKWNGNLREKMEYFLQEKNLLSLWNESLHFANRSSKNQGIGGKLGLICKCGKLGLICIGGELGLICIGGELGLICICGELGLICLGGHSWGDLYGLKCKRMQD